MSYFQFIKTRQFFLHFFLASLIAVLLMWAGLKMASVYTAHNITVQVPDFTGQSIGSLDEFIKDKKLRYQVIDSIFDPKQKPGTVIKQDPEKGSEVKEGRVIYLYATSVMPPQMEMPKLVDRSLRQAIAMIESYGLKAGKITPVSDPCKNCVVRQFYNGKEVEPGTLIKKGAVIDLQIGRGQGNETVNLPDVCGMTFCDAKNKLLAAALQPGNIIVDKAIDDTCNAFVYRQTPAGKGAEINTGAKIDLYITADKSKVELLNDEND